MKTIKFLLLSSVILSLNACNIFEKDETLLAEHQKSTGEKIKISFVTLGATTNDVIQVSKSDTAIWSLDKHNYLKTSDLINDTTLRLVLGDSNSVGISKKFDTVFVNVK